MYARVGIVTDAHANALVVPTNALVDVNGTRGVYLAVNNAASFRPVKTGIEGPMRTEILDGVAEGDRVVTTGAAGLRNGDPIVLAAGQRGGAEGARGGRGGRGGRGQNQTNPGAQPQAQGETQPQGQGETPGTRENNGNFGGDRGAGSGQGTGQAGPRQGGEGQRGGAGRRGGGGGQRRQPLVAAPPTGPETR